MLENFYILKWGSNTVPHYAVLIHLWTDDEILVKIFISTMADDEFLPWQMTKYS